MSATATRPLHVGTEQRGGITYYRVVFNDPTTGKRITRRWRDEDQANRFARTATDYGLDQAIAFDDRSRVTAAPTATGSAMPFGKYAQTYVQRRRSIGEATRKVYIRESNKIGRHALAAVPIRDVTADHIEAYTEWLGTLGHKSRTQRFSLQYVKTVLSDAYKRGDIPTNPGAYVENVHVDDALDPVILDAVEFDAIAAHLSRDEILFHTFLLQSGLRYTELTGLQWSDLRATDTGITLVDVYPNAERGLKSTAATRTTTVPTWLVSELPLRDAVFVFATPSSASHRHAWVAAVRAAQNPLTAAPGHALLTKTPRPHDLRHTHAVRMLTEAHMNLIALAARLGHATPTTTARYYARFAERQISALGEAAAAAMFRPAAFGSPLPV